jgi:hypothetical protein
MKTITLIGFLFLTTCLAAQVFQPRDVVFGLAGGFQTIEFNLSDSAGYRARNGDLVGANFTFRSEYGVAEFMGFGLSISYTDLLTESSNDITKCSMVEITPDIDYHVPWQNSLVDLTGSAGVGISSYTYNQYEGINARSEIDMLMFFADIHPRFYFSRKNRSGIFLFYRFAYYSGTGRSGDNFTAMHDFYATGISHSAGLGYFYRFGRKRVTEIVD